MKKKRFGIVIQVKNLTSCKAFYRDVLELGDPVMDSNFRVVFQIGESFRLTLEKSPWDAELPAASERISWLCSENAQILCRRMKDYGYPIPDVSGTAEKNGWLYCRFTDPEGNPFYASTEKI